MMSKFEFVTVFLIVLILVITAWLVLISPNNFSEIRPEFRCWYNIVDTCKVSNTCEMLSSDGNRVVVKKWNEELDTCLVSPMSWNIPFSLEQYEDFFKKFCGGI